MSPEVIGRLAQQYSTCGSAQKTPDASFKMLRGRPGELTFKRGEMAKEFENVAFTAPVGSLSVVDTQFGSHLIYINARDDADPKAGRGKKSKKQKGFGVRGGFVAPTRTRPSTNLAASKLPPLVEKLQLLVPLGFVAQISFLVASNQISGPENLEEYGRIGTEYLKTNTDFSGPRGEVMRIQSEAQQIWWNNVLRDLEAGRPVKPPITSPYPKYELFKGGGVKCGPKSSSTYTNLTHARSWPGKGGEEGRQLVTAHVTLLSTIGFGLREEERRAGEGEEGKEEASC